MFLSRKRSVVKQNWEIITDVSYLRQWRLKYGLSSFYCLILESDTGFLTVGKMHIEIDWEKGTVEHIYT